MIRHRIRPEYIADELRATADMLRDLGRRLDLICASGGRNIVEAVNNIPGLDRIDGKTADALALVADLVDDTASPLGLAPDQEDAR